MIDVKIDDSGLNINVSIEGSGPPGKAGEDGVSPTVDVIETENGHRVTITDKDGAKSFEVANGTDGKSPYVGENGHWFEWRDGEYVDTGKVAEGRNGDDGVSPTVEVTQTGTGHKVVITDKDGEKSFDVSNGQNGEDGEDGVSPTIAVEDVEGGHKVIITGAAGPKEFVVLDGKNGDPGDPGENGQTPSITIGTVETLPSDSPATAEIIGQTPNLTMNLGIPKGPKGDPGSGGGAGGELLLAEYTHQGNQEIHFTSFDWETGIGECTEPHGLSKVTEVIFVPNDWKYSSIGLFFKYIPVEWALYQQKIYALPVSDTSISIVGNDKITPINIDPGNAYNADMNISKIHLEVPISWSIGNLPINPTSLRMVICGYSSATRYRYFCATDTYNRKIIFGPLAMASFGTVSKPKHMIFSVWSVTLELFRYGAVFVIGGIRNHGRRDNFTSATGETGVEEFYQTPEIFLSKTDPSDERRFSSIGNPDGYAFLSNNSIVRIYAKGVKQE